MTPSSLSQLRRLITVATVLRWRAVLRFMEEAARIVAMMETRRWV